MHLQPPLYFFSSHCLYAEKNTVELLQRPLFPGTATTAGFDSLTVLHDQLRRNIYKCVVQAGACDLHHDGIKELSEGKTHYYKPQVIKQSFYKLFYQHNC